MKLPHRMTEAVARNLAEIDRISIVRISPDLPQASGATSVGVTGRALTTPRHPTAIGVSLVLHPDVREVRFCEITSAVRGYGGRLVDAVPAVLPEEWTGVPLTDWSEGFWEEISRRRPNWVVC